MIYNDANEIFEVVEERNILKKVKLQKNNEIKLEEFTFKSIPN